ncbi:MAG: DUF547 domain-containing protein [Deltaproteobacteria bacterium]|nr:DUF547 domain-containing protein [Deltaproteobacteria bacterium]
MSPQGVTYAAIGPAGLDPFLAELAAVDLRELNSIEQKALYINAYNALTLDLIAENPGVASIRDLDGGKVWSTRRFTVGGQSLTLDDIEHKRLRPMGDPRVHAPCPAPPKVAPPCSAGPTPPSASTISSTSPAAPGCAATPPRSTPKPRPSRSAASSTGTATTSWPSGKTRPTSPASRANSRPR